MVNQNPNVQYSNLIESMNQAFDNGKFYGMEYVLDELDSEKPAPANQNTIDWFGATDYFA